MVRETRHLWVGNLPENVREDEIKEHFRRYGHVESVRMLPQRTSGGGAAAFVDFVDVKSARKANNAANRLGKRDLRTDYKQPGADETASITSDSSEVSGLRGGGGGRPTYGSLHAWEGRSERRRDGASETRKRSYERNAYGHHEPRGTERTRLYDQDLRDPYDRAFQSGIYYPPRRSPGRPDAPDPRYESRSRERFPLSSHGYRNDISREGRGRRPEWSYRHRSRSPPSSQSSPHRLALRTSRSARSPSGSWSIPSSRDIYTNDKRGRWTERSHRHTRSRSPPSSQSSPHRLALRASRSTRSPSGSWSIPSSRDIYANDIPREGRGRRPERSYRHTRSRSPHSSQSSTHKLPIQASRSARSHSGSWSIPSSRDSYKNDFPREGRGRRPKRSYRHSRSHSPHSRLASQASRSARSPSGSRSRLPSGDSSDESPARSVHAASPFPPDNDEPYQSFGIKVGNLPVRSTDTSLKDGLFHEFKKSGKVSSVQIHGVSEERYGLVFFRQQEDQEQVLSASKGKLFFGRQIEVTAWGGPETQSENELRPLDEPIDEFHPKASRTLFIGNLPKTTTPLDLHNVFQRFGEILNIEIKKVNKVPLYAFLQYCDITSVCQAIKKMDGEYLGKKRLKLGFGKSMPSNCLWIDGLTPSVTEQDLTAHFSRYGSVLKVVYERLKGTALILYSEMEFALAALRETKREKIGGNSVQVDFANEEIQLASYGSRESSGPDSQDIDDISERRSAETRRGSSNERTHSKTVRTAGAYKKERRRASRSRSREVYPDRESDQDEYYEQRYFRSREDRDYRKPFKQDVQGYSYRRSRSLDFF
ncbi:hypothetical protein GDO78_017137 [Eleutherodactylus coqui]|uniref:RRM domain-containing protein n=1 Tax=Eleutherodactylus coqui TaxID=57060 RepID=A0A8J6EA88_ELECQ|nr:hypothetical protein GDO78_017137 [Eleutherodactylus coqui]